MIDQALADQRLQRLPDRDAADPEQVGRLVDGDRAARRHVTGQDGAAEFVEDRLLGEARVIGGEDRRQRRRTAQPRNRFPGLRAVHRRELLTYTVKSLRSPPYCLGSGASYSVRVLVARPIATRDSTVLVAAATPSTTGTPTWSATIPHTVGHPGAAQHEDVGAVLLNRTPAFLDDFLLGRRTLDIQLQDGDLAGPHVPAERVHPVPVGQLPRPATGAAERGDHGEPAAEETRGPHSGLGDPDDRAVGQFTRGVQSGVAEAGDDVPVHAVPLALGDLVQQSGDGERLVIVALDRRRAHGRADRLHQGSVRGHGPGALTDLLGHRPGGVRVDHLDQHRGSAFP